MMQQECGVGMGRGVSMVLLLLVHFMHSVAGQSVAQLSHSPDNILYENLGISTRIGVGTSNRNTAPEICTTPEGQQGECGLVSECQIYLPLIKDIRDSDVRQFFIDRVCRLASQAIEICCPLNSNRPSSTSTTTQSPTIPPTFPIQFDKDSQSQPGQGRPAQQLPRRPSISPQRPNGRKPVSIDSPSGDSPSLFTPASTQPTPDLPSPLSPIPPVQPTQTGSLQPSHTFPVRASSTVGFPSPQPFIPDRVGATVPDRQGTTSPDTDELPVPSSIIPSEGECGFLVPNNRSRRQNLWPWLVSLGQLEESEFEVVCGGALITRRHVLAAAHCLTDSRLPNPTHVRLRNYNLGQSNDLVAPEDFSILNFTDAGYTSDSFENDLALVTLSKDVTFSDFVQPVCLPFRFKYDGFRYQDLNVVGWGSTLTESSQARQTELQDVQVSVIGLGDCHTTFQRSVSTLVVDRRQLCGLGGAKACVTDNGAPMFFLDEDTTGRYFLVGIVSYGFGCQQPDLPGVYTRVGAFLDWIQKNLK